MRKSIQKLLCCLLTVVAASISQKALATHVYGADFYYTHVSGNTYTITLAVYGDCSGAAFPSLQGATATAIIYNNNTQVGTTTLVQQGQAVEVTPVCPSQINNTVCVNPSSSIPGVKRYIYSANYTLSGTSANWRFRFDGAMSTSSTGRSNSITNIQTGSIMALEATLNNVPGPNSSPVYTTIPTPFFCINKPANYNPGTVDANGDQLTYALVPGLLQGSGFVTYTGGASATNPLTVAAGTFNFSTTSGQLSFTPNAIQRSLVVGKVSEYRNGILVGTSMREMTFVVLANCNNNPPGGNISNTSTGVNVINSTAITVCASQGLFTFNINPTDLDGDNINVTSAGIPAGATLNLTGNNTPNPSMTFTWNVTNVTPGTYNFFITYQDDGCPLSSKQTQAYSITVLPNPELNFALVSPATCSKKAVFTLSPASGPAPYNITITGSTLTYTGVTGPITDSLAPGTYTFTITNANNCKKDTIITFAPPPSTLALSAAIKKSTCSTLGDGKVTLSATGGATPYTYSLGSGPFSTNNVFSPLAAGTYAFSVRDTNGCIANLNVTITDSLIIAGNVTITDALCKSDSTGTISVAGTGGQSPYTYALGTNPYTTSGSFNGLPAGTYTLNIKDANGCTKNYSLTVNEPTVVVPTATVTNVTCNGQTNGSISAGATGGTPGYTYAIDTNPYGASSTFSGLAAGTYTIYVKDNNGCVKNVTANVTQPAPLTFSFAITNVLCFGTSTGSVAVTAGGGTPGYTYAADANPFGASNTLTGLAVGSHTIHLKDANGCTKDSSVTLTEPPVLNLGYTSVQPSCNAGTNGTITITGTGGTTPYQYAVDATPFQGSGFFNNQAAGTHVLHVKDVNGCTKDSTITMSEPPAITVSAFVKKPRCTPLVNGIVWIYAGGGTPGYTYAVGTGAYGASSQFSGLGSGTYTFHIKDANACIKDTTITVQDSVFVHANLTINSALCYNQASGSIAISPFGGDTPYVYAVNTNPYSATNPINNLLAGTYVLHVKDSNGCRLDTNVAVAQPTIIVPSIALTQPSCYGLSDGIITAGATGGTPGYTYALGTGAYGAATAFTGLPTGSYTVHVKDVNGCVRDTTFTLPQPTPLLIDSIRLSHVRCFGDNSGYVNVFASGATPAYAYAADAGAFGPSATVTGLNVGAHVIHVQDANGCAKDSTITLTQPPKLQFVPAVIKTPTCEGFKDGAVTVFGIGGTPGPGYLYSPDNATWSIRNNYPGLAEGTYTFYIKDSLNCVHDTTIDLKGYPHILINAPVITGVSCYGLGDGVIRMNVTGGNQPLTYQMLKPATTTDAGIFDSLKMGTYTVRVQDAKGCFKDTVLKVAQPDSLNVATTVTPNDCVGLDDAGGVKTEVTGGTKPYAYLWSTGGATAEITGMANGKYRVWVTDANNCRDSAFADVLYDDCCRPYVPNAFTPNGDGRNDKFRIRFKGDAKLVQFSIYNRFGQRVYNGVNIDEGWDGTFAGVPQDMNTYFYYIKLICGNKGDDTVEYKGDLELIR